MKLRIMPPCKRCALQSNPVPACGWGQADCVVVGDGNRNPPQTSTGNSSRKERKELDMKINKQKQKFMNRFMQEKFNFGGEIKTRIEIINEVHTIFTNTDGGKWDQKYADWLLFCFFQRNKPIV